MHEAPKPSDGPRAKARDVWYCALCENAIGVGDEHGARTQTWNCENLKVTDKLVLILNGICPIPMTGLQSITAEN
jgi:hypothetical protein